MDRRNFTRGLIAATAAIITAPAIVKAENLMKIAVLKNDVKISHNWHDEIFTGQWNKNNYKTYYHYRNYRNYRILAVF